MNRKLYVGLDPHKENIVIALAFSVDGEAQTYGQVSSDLDCLVRVLRNIQSKCGPEKLEPAHGINAL